MKDIGVKIFGIVLIILGVTSIVVVTIAINETVSENEMTTEKWLWIYSARWRRTTSTGAIQIWITPSNQQVIEIEMINMLLASAANRNCSVYHKLPSGQNMFLIDQESIANTGSFVYPNTNFIAGFDGCDMNPYLLVSGDKLYFQVDGALNGEAIYLDIRAYVSNGARPTVTPYDTNSDLHIEYSNKLIAVL